MTTSPPEPTKKKEEKNLSHAPSQTIIYRGWDDSLRRVFRKLAVVAIQPARGTILGCPGRSYFANRLEARNGLFGFDGFWGSHRKNKTGTRLCLRGGLCQSSKTAQVGGDLHIFVKS